MTRYILGQICSPLYVVGQPENLGLHAANLTFSTQNAELINMRIIICVFVPTFGSLLGN
jgi:hypothetical protein